MQRTTLCGTTTRQRRKQATGMHQRMREELDINKKGKKRLKTFCPSTCIKQKQW
jgi:hypothetical protein